MRVICWILGHKYQWEFTAEKDIYPCTRCKRIGGVRIGGNLLIRGNL